MNIDSTVNPEYFVRTQFSYPGLSNLSYAWNFRTVAGRCKFSDLLFNFCMHFIFVRKPPRTKYTKITYIQNILDLQYSLNSKGMSSAFVCFPMRHLQSHSVPFAGPVILVRLWAIKVAELHKRWLTVRIGRLQHIAAHFDWYQQQLGWASLHCKWSFLLPELLCFQPRVACTHTHTNARTHASTHTHTHTRTHARTHTHCQHKLNIYGASMTLTVLILRRKVFFSWRWPAWVIQTNTSSYDNKTRII